MLFPTDYFKFFPTSFALPIIPFLPQKVIFSILENVSVSIPKIFTVSLRVTTSVYLMLFILFPGGCFRFSLQAVPVCALLISSFFTRKYSFTTLEISSSFTPQNCPNIHYSLPDFYLTMFILCPRDYPQYFPYLPTNYLLFLTYKYSLSTLEISSSFTLKYFTIFPVLSHFTS